MIQFVVGVLLGGFTGFLVSAVFSMGADDQNELKCNRKTGDENDFDK